MTAAQHELVLYGRDEPVVTITLNRSEKRNAFNAELVKELRAALLRFEADDDAFVAVLTGSGPCFSSGADVGERQIRFRCGVRSTWRSTRAGCSHGRSS